MDLPSLSTLGHFSLLGSVHKVGIVSVILLVFSLLLADFFDTMGTMVAIGAEGDLLDEHGNPPKTREILVVDSLAAIAGGVGGVSSNTSYVESAAGVGEGPARAWPPWSPAACSPCPCSSHRWSRWSPTRQLPRHSWWSVSS